MRCVSGTFLQGGAILNAYIIFLLRFCLNDAKIILFDNNLNEQITHNEVVLVNFYADWCRFSQHLKPIFESASNKFDNEPPGKVAFVSVDCDRHSDVCSKYNVNKYPTLKLFRNGELIKKEYRGQRSADAIAEYIQKQAEVKVGEINSLDDLKNKIDNSKSNVIGFFKQKNSAEHKNFLKVASALRDDCTFHAGTGDWISSVLVAANAPNSVIFRERVIAEESPYTGRLDNYNQMKFFSICFSY